MEGDLQNQLIGIFAAQPAPSDTSAADEEHHKQGLRELVGRIWNKLVHWRTKDAAECACRRCDDFISQLHTEGRKLDHAHHAEKLGLTHWNKEELPMYNPPPPYGTGTVDDVVLVRKLMKSEDVLNALANAENQWAKTHSKDCKLGNDYWKTRIEEYKTKEEP